MQSEKGSLQNTHQGMVRLQKQFPGAAALPPCPHPSLGDCLPTQAHRTVMLGQGWKGRRTASLPEADVPGITLVSNTNPGPTHSLLQRETGTPEGPVLALDWELIKTSHSPSPSSSTLNSGSHKDFRTKLDLQHHLLSCSPFLPQEQPLLH